MRLFHLVNLHGLSGHSVTAFFVLEPIISNVRLTNDRTMLFMLSLAYQLAFFLNLPYPGTVVLTVTQHFLPSELSTYL